MGELLEVKKADELFDAEFMAKWQVRRAIDPLAQVVHRRILEHFIATGGPVSVETIAAYVPEYRPAKVYAAIARLDEKDLIFTRAGQVLVAYPFAGTSTAFTVILPGGRERHAVCAIDALGVSAMLGEPVTIRSRCHHCGEPLEIHAAPDGPTDGREIMVWVGERADIRQKACTSFCLTLTFFRSQDHLREWRSAHREVPGAAARLDEAFKIGRTIFGEWLRDIFGFPPGG